MVMWFLRALWRLLFGALRRLLRGNGDDDEPFNASSRLTYPEDHHSRTSDRPPSSAARSVVESIGSSKLRAEDDESKRRISDLKIDILGSSAWVSAAPVPSSKKPYLAPECSTVRTFSKVQIEPDSPSPFNSPSIRPSGALAQPSRACPSPNPSHSSSSSNFQSSPFSSISRISPAPSSSANSKVSEVRIKINSEKPSSSISPLIPPPITSSFSETSPPHSSPSNGRSLPIYEIPKYLEDMIKKDIVPPVLSSPLSLANYAGHFAALLYAEDFYIQKWSKYLLEGVLLELRPRKTLSSQSNSSIVKKNNKLVNRDFVAFHVDAVPEKRPFLLSRDFVFLKPPNEMAGPFKGILFRVEKNVVLVEFGEDFHLQHSPSKRYDVSFSFNRVCLKRAHQAISASSDPSFHSILFPIEVPSLLHGNIAQSSHQLPITRIMNHKGPFPYLIEGPLSVTQTLAPTDDEEGRCLSVTGRIIQEAILNIYSRNPICKILVCSPRNSTSDVLLRSLSYKMPKWMLFRANAAFRNYTEVPDDIIPASLYEEEEECFAFPPPLELRNFIVITSTFMSSFRLRAAGIDNEHFTHIFLVDSSLATEPETIVPLANLAGKKTVVIVSGCLSKVPGWVRSNIARKHGLKVSYFHRLCKREPYRSRADMFISHIE